MFSLKACNQFIKVRSEFRTISDQCSAALNTEIHMPRRGSRVKNWPCEFCSEIFSSEWAKIHHSSNEHKDLNEIFSLMLEDQKEDGALTDLTQYFDPSSLDIIKPQL